MFIPALSPHYDLDHLLLPVASRLSRQILISAAELSSSGRMFPPLPGLPGAPALWLDSGGFAAFEHRNSVQARGPLGLLKRPGQGDLTPSATGPTNAHVRRSAETLTWRLTHGLQLRATLLLNSSQSLPLTGYHQRLEGGTQARRWLQETRHNLNGTRQKRKPRS